MSQHQPQQGQDFPGPNSGYGYSAQPHDAAEGQKHAQMSLVFGIIGLFVLGIVLGPLAIVQAGKAEKLGQQATAGKVLGWISTILGALGLIMFVLMIAGMIGMSGQSGY
jgi:uncharacterized Tic20 family protein